MSHEPLTVPKPPRIKERDFQRDVVKAARALGWRVHHEGNSFGTAPGWPDLAMFHPEHGVLFLELKTHPNKPTRHQNDWIDTIRAAGQTAYIVYPEDWDAVENLLNGRRLEAP